MRYEFLIGLRYLRARRRERFVSIIAIISLAGIAIGTFTLSVALSVMSGFEKDLRARLLAFTPQVTIERTDGGVWNPADLEKKIAAMPEVEASAPYVTSQVMAVSSTDSGAPGLVSGGILRGVQPHDNPVLKELKSTLENGTLADLETTHPVTIVEKGVKRVVQLPGAILGKSLAYELGVRPGDAVILISPTSLGAGIGPPRLKRFVVTGFFHSGMYDFDSTLAFVALKDGRALLADDASLESGLELRLHNMFDAPQVRDKIAAMAGPDFEVKDWTTANAPLFAALALEKFTYFMVLLLIVLVAAFNIIATLVMVVMERRREIAIVRTMGARAASVASIFLCEGAALGVIGTVLGVGAGFVTAFLIGRYHLIHLPADMFMVSAVPVMINPWNFVLVAAATIVLCLAAAIYPALQAARLSPVEVIRYE
ncbi:FtsX-like permease family protein [Candidatus Binatus sp.]|uniref:FtsX-like permease family protein n=2 Tax=Candidatus Binatus sp. TaxID=2811406 RepID=UPI003C710B35